MNLAMNQLLYVLNKYALNIVLLHLIWTVSPDHFYVCAFLYMTQVSLDLTMSARIDKLRHDLLVERTKADGKRTEEAGKTQD